MTEPMPAQDAFSGAVRLANQLKIAIGVPDPDGVWKKEWGDSTEMKASDGRTHRRAPRLSVAFALLAIFSIPARADFRVCNKTHALINIAVGTDAGEAFKTEGWWVATPGSCATPVRGPLKSRFVYLYATDIDGVDLVTGTATMCIDRGKFVAYGAENCWRRGLQAVTFAEIDTLDSGDWTTFLTDPRK
jgi:uncharacterized membrane protein